MNMSEMLKDLVERGYIDSPNKDAVPNLPNNGLYAPTTISYGVNVKLQNTTGVDDAKLARGS